MDAIAVLERFLNAASAANLALQLPEPSSPRTNNIDSKNKVTGLIRLKLAKLGFVGNNIPWKSMVHKSGEFIVSEWPASIPQPLKLRSKSLSTHDWNQIISELESKPCRIKFDRQSPLSRRQERRASGATKNSHEQTDLHTTNALPSHHTSYIPSPVTNYSPSFDAGSASQVAISSSEIQNEHNMACDGNEEGTEEDRHSIPTQILPSDLPSPFHRSTDRNNVADIIEERINRRQNRNRDSMFVNHDPVSEPASPIATQNLSGGFRPRVRRSILAPSEYIFNFLCGLFMVFIYFL
jgi:hypothetical protein